MIESPQTAFELYVDLIIIVRTLFQTCKLVHADLSEYNILYHQQSLWIIDVGQAVEHDHPLALEFLRKDCLNINAYFEKHITEILPLRAIFDFVVQPLLLNIERDQSSIRKILLNQISAMSQSSFSYLEEIDEKVFLEAYIPRTLNEVVDIERDIDKLASGDTEDLLYCNLGALPTMQDDQDTHVAPNFDEGLYDNSTASSSPHVQSACQNVPSIKGRKKATQKAGQS